MAARKEHRSRRSGKKYKLQFAEPLAQLMMNCRVGRTENPSATEEEINNSLRRKAAHVSKAAEIPTLHRAITTAAELRKYLGSRATHMGIDKVEPMVLEEFIWQSHARFRAFNAISWMCENLQLGWPIDSVARLSVVSLDAVHQYSVGGAHMAVARSLPSV